MPLGHISNNPADLMAEGRDNGQVYLGLNLDTSELLAVNQVLDFCDLFIRFALCGSRRSGSHPSPTSMPQLSAPPKQDYRVQVYSPPQNSPVQWAYRRYLPLLILYMAV